MVKPSHFSCMASGWGPFRLHNFFRLAEKPKAVFVHYSLHRRTYEIQGSGSALNFILLSYERLFGKDYV